MLRINQQRSASGAKSYFEEGLAREDYYTRDAVPGRWGGKGAERLGLVGAVEKQAFLDLCDNRHPATGEPLTPRTRANRTVLYDLNFHAPKSLSLLYTLTKDDRLLNAFRAAVRDTMSELEADVLTRVRQGRQNTERTTGNLLFAEFVHLTARPVNGVPDPHLHAHCVTFNATYDGVEDRWKAAQFRPVVRDAPYFEAAFHSRLSKAVADLGLATVRTKAGWEVAGLDKPLLDKFSRRTALIDELAHQKGVTTDAEKAALGAKTREKKGDPRSLDALRAEWKSRLSVEEKRSVMAVLSGRGRSEEPPVTKGEAVDHALKHSFERASVVADRRVRAAALKRGYGSVGVEEVTGEFHSRPEVIRRKHGDQPFVTTREVLAEEAAALHFVREGRGTCKPFDPAGSATLPSRLNRDQTAAVRHVLASSDRVVLIRGAAGTGKTTLLKAAAEAIRASGTDVSVFAPTSEAARGVLRGEGFAAADTVARLLVDTQLQEAVKGRVIWVDEAGLVGSRDMNKLFRVAEEQNARVVLMGDDKQHAGVARGDAFRLLQSHGGLPAAEVGTVQRQRGEYRRAVEALARGDLEAGFEKLDRMGCIREVSDDVRHAVLAADYLSAGSSGQSALVVAPTHAEGRAVTARIREGLKAAGALAGEERVLPSLHSHGMTEAMRQDGLNYQPGDVVQFHQNVKGGFRKGEAVVVLGRDDRGNVRVRRGRHEPASLPLDQAKHFDVYERRDLSLAIGDRVRITRNGTTADGQRLLNGSLHTVTGFTPAGDVRLDGSKVVGREFGHLTHGYATTSHASQGKTVDRVLIALGPESVAAGSREQFYVSVSRGRESVTVYTHDKQALHDAVSRSGERLSATELTAAPRDPPADRARLLRHGEHTRRVKATQPAREPDRGRDTRPRSATLRRTTPELGLDR